MRRLRHRLSGGTSFESSAIAADNKIGLVGVGTSPRTSMTRPSAIRVPRRLGTGMRHLPTLK